MKGTSRYEAKLVRALERALTNERSHLRTYYWLGKGAAFAGGLLVGIALITALKGRESSVAWLVGLAAVGGTLIGLSIYFGSSVRQWPVVKRFLNAEAVHAAAREHEL
jgi:hypothetical protein